QPVAGVEVVVDQGQVDAGLGGDRADRESGGAVTLQDVSCGAVALRPYTALVFVRKARIGIIGTGWWATYAHLPSLTSYERAEVVAIADPSAERLARAAEHFGIATQFADYQTMLDRADLDGVVVATPHTTHYAIATDVLRRGIALLLEKPMVLHAREARDLV